MKCHAYFRGGAFLLTSLKCSWKCIHRHTQMSGSSVILNPSTLTKMAADSEGFQWTGGGRTGWLLLSPLSSRSICSLVSFDVWHLSYFPQPVEASTLIWEVPQPIAIHRLCVTIRCHHQGWGCDCGQHGWESCEKPLLGFFSCRWSTNDQIIVMW